MPPAGGRGLLYEGLPLQRRGVSVALVDCRWVVGFVASLSTCWVGRPTVAGGRGLVRLEVVGSVDAELRSAMVGELRAAGLVTVAEVEAAMRAVPRHEFLPGVELVEAYGQQSVVTHRDADGAYRLPAADVSGALLVVDKKVSRIVVRACPRRPEPSSS